MQYYFIYIKVIIYDLKIARQQWGFWIRVYNYRRFFSFLLRRLLLRFAYFNSHTIYRQIIDPARIDISYWFAACLQEEQVARVRQGMSERVQQLESQIQGKLEQARERRESIEREQKEKLRNHVSFW